MKDSRDTFRTAGIIIIGNEILSGKVQDSNSFYLASELRVLGVSLMRISVIPDDIETIGNEAALFSKSYDHVFTSGGVGPTHDDITMEGIARGFDVRLIRHPGLEKFFRLQYRGSLNAALMKMADAPEGAEIILLNDMQLPVVLFGNIFIFPGIPEYLREKFSAVKERFRCAAFYLKRLFLDADESDIAAILNSVVAENIEVAFGSYPILGNAEYKIIVTAESKSSGSLDKAVKDLLSRLPEDVIVRVE